VLSARLADFQGARFVDPWLIIVCAVLGAGIALVAIARQRRAVNAASRRNAAMSAFAAQLPDLGPAFLAAAAATGKPRGLRWEACRLDGEPVFAVDRTSGELFALVGATVSFSAIPGGGMEEVEAVGNLRAATAVFVHRGGQWSTDGRVVFNLGPAEALNHYRDSLAPASVAAR
jgi:hypothetical protein